MLTGILCETELDMACNCCLIQMKKNRIRWFTLITEHLRTWPIFITVCVH